jgi:hypothetical protein
MRSRDLALAEESAWLKSIDQILDLGYEPVMAVFRNDRGELETFSILGRSLADFVVWLATGTPSTDQPGFEQ